MPLSLNAWLYVYDNPINYLDPSGQSPYDVLPPDVYNYNPMVPPRDIYWLENPNTNRINSEKAPGLPVDENAAQNHIPGHDDEYHNCGDVAVSAIIHLGHPEITARDIVDLIHHRVDEGTLASELVKVINANYGDSFSAVKITPPVDTMSTLTNWLRRQILAGNILIPQVAILQWLRVKWHPKNRRKCRYYWALGNNYWNVNTLGGFDPISKYPSLTRWFKMELDSNI
jgi:hypothetical protein